MSDFTCLVLADGKGTRFGMEKQFFNWRGKVLWEHVYNTILDLTPYRVVVGIDIAGGSTRQASVKSGLRLVDTPRVVILEACRPLITTKDLEALIATDGPSIGLAMKAGGACFAPMGELFSPYDNAWVTQGTGIYDTKLLKSVHQNTYDDNGDLDDTTLMYIHKEIKPKFVQSSLASLYSVIYPEDIAVIDALSLTLS